MRLFFFIAGVLFLAFVFYGFFHPLIVAWVMAHPILDWFIVLLLIFFLYVNAFLNDGPSMK
jgi:hypothetical protein